MLNRNVGIIESLKSNNLKQIADARIICLNYCVGGRCIENASNEEGPCRKLHKTMEAVCLNDKITNGQLITLMYFFSLCKSHVYYNDTRKIQSIFGCADEAACPQKHVLSGLRWHHSFLLKT
jgi:hypothetical protein